MEVQGEATSVDHKDKSSQKQQLPNLKLMKAAAKLKYKTLN
jgi:hypothetical protein